VWRGRLERPGVLWLQMSRQRYVAAAAVLYEMSILTLAKIFDLLNEILLDN
jgi:hypothetical protein